MAARFWCTMLALFLICNPAPAAKPSITAGQRPQEPVTPGGYAYQLFIPSQLPASKDRRWPLLIFLHGSGERGADIAKVKVHGPPKVADGDPDFPFILISPP